MFLTSNVQASIIELNCIYKSGKKEILIDEKTKKISNEIYINKNWDYRNSGPDIYIYEIMEFQYSDKRPDVMIRFIIDLEKMEEKKIYVGVHTDDAKQVKIALAKHKKGEVSYEEINKMKKEIFNKMYKHPEDYKDQDKAIWIDGKGLLKDGHHPEDYWLFGYTADLEPLYQYSLTHKCTIVN